MTQHRTLEHPPRHWTWPHLTLLLALVTCSAHGNVTLRVIKAADKPNGVWTVSRTITTGDPTPNRCRNLMGMCSIRVFAVSKSWPGHFRNGYRTLDDDTRWDKCLGTPANATLGDVATCLYGTTTQTVTDYLPSQEGQDPLACAFFSIGNNMSDTTPVEQHCVDPLVPNHTCSFDVNSAALHHTGKANVEIGGAPSNPVPITMACTTEGRVSVHLDSPVRRIEMGGSATQYATIDLGAGPGVDRVVTVKPGVATVMQVTSHLYGKYIGGNYSGTGSIIIEVN